LSAVACPQQQTRNRSWVDTKKASRIGGRFIAPGNHPNYLDPLF
jgi:hypothetical protein